MFPFVQDEHEAARAVAVTRAIRQRAMRGAAGTHRGSRYGTVPGYSKIAVERDLRDRADRDARRRSSGCR